MLKKFSFTKKKDKNKLIDTVKDKSNSDKLDLIISEIKNINYEIRSIKLEIIEFKNDFETYKKQDSNFQEAQVNNFIVSELNNISTCITKLLPIKYIYTPYHNKILSELDGVILYTPNQNKMPSISKELLDRTDKEFHKSLKDNITQINTIFTKPYLIIVESKRSLNKQKVDTKLQKIFEFINILSSLDKINMSSVSDNFKEMVNIIKNTSQLSISELSSIDVMFMFGSDDVSLELKNYIIGIEEGMDNEKYNNITESLFNKDIYTNGVIKKWIESIDTTKRVKSKLKQYKTFEELKQILKEYLGDYDMGYITEYLTPYVDLEHIFKAFKGKIGITQFNEIQFPQILQSTL